MVGGLVKLFIIKQLSFFLHHNRKNLKRPLIKTSAIHLSRDARGNTPHLTVRMVDFSSQALLTDHTHICVRQPVCEYHEKCPGFISGLFGYFLLLL